jgi:anion-transporting  ArsA/GET3 family ATPase
VTQLAGLLKRRVVLVTGKGGVGRSSVTAALATVAARAGKRVVVTEIGDIGGESSNFARLFGLEQLPATVKEIAPGIDGTLLQAHLGQELFLRSVLPIPALAKAALASEALRRLLVAAPSFREMGVFFHLLTLLRQERHPGVPEHDIVLIDMPATGHTLALTGLPEVLLRLVSRGPIANALREGQAYLNDPALGAAYVVTLPETLPVSETLELLAGLSKTNMPAGGVILNRMPEDVFTAAEREALGPIIARTNLLGADGFARVAEAQKSMARLKAEVSCPLITIPETTLEGKALVQALAKSLENGGAS